MNERQEGIATQRASGGIAPPSPGNRPDATQKKKKKKKKSPLKKRIVLRIHRNKSKREREAEYGSALKPGPEEAAEREPASKGGSGDLGDTPRRGL